MIQARCCANCLESADSSRRCGARKIESGSPGAELAYLLRHDPQFRGVHREHLREVGKRLRLKSDLHTFAQVLRERLPARFHFCVISASPREVVQSALGGIVPAENLESLRKDPRSKPSFSDLDGPVTKTTTADPPSDGF